MSTILATDERLEHIATQCRSRYQPFPEPLISAICEYAAGGGSLLQIKREWKAAKISSRYYISNFVVFSDLSAERLDEMDLRILEICLATNTAGAYFQSLADSPLLEQAHEHMREMKLSAPKIIKALMACHSFLKEREDEQAEPTALGRLLLSYLPDHFDTMLKNLDVKGWSYSDHHLFALLLAAQPEGYLDMAEQVARATHPQQVDAYVAQLLKADPARFTTWAREVAAASLQNPQQYHYTTLEALLATDPASHLDLALAAAKAPLPTQWWHQVKLQCLGLEAAFRFDPAQHLPLVEAAAISAHPNYGKKAVELLKDDDVERARPILQRCVASGHVDAALAALDVLMNQRWPERRSYAISLLAHPTKKIRAAILPWLWGETFRDETAALVDGIFPSVLHKKLFARHYAVLALQQIKDARVPGMLAPRLDKEKAQPVKLAILDTSGVAQAITPPAATPRTPAAALVAEAEAVLRYAPQAPLSWFDPAQAPALRWASGEVAPPVVLRYLLFRQSRVTNATLAQEIRQAVPLFDRASTGEFALALWNGWAEHGAKSSEAWCLTALCALGDVRLIQTLRQNIDGWSKGARGALAAKTARAMAYIPSDLALAEISHLAERAKNRQVRQAAQDAITASAANLGISLDDLTDRIVPTFGFDERSERSFDYGTRQFSARLRFDQTVQLADANGKRLKNLPALKAQDDASKASLARAAWKLLKKQTPQVLSLQTQRMEAALIAQRAWDVATWQRVFIKHPLLRSLAAALVWGVADASGHGYLCTFRPLEDGTLTDSEDAPVALPAEGHIRLVHPAAIDAREQVAWVQHLADYEVTPPFPQMNRAVVRLDAAQRAALWWEECQGYLIHHHVLITRSSKAGWEQRGRSHSGNSLWKAFPAAGMEAVQQGNWLVPDGTNGADFALIRLAFVQANALTRNGYVYDDLQEQDARIIPLGQVPPAIFSEAAASIQAIAALGQYDAEWQKKLPRS